MSEFGVTRELIRKTEDFGRRLSLLEVQESFNWGGMRDAAGWAYASTTAGLVEAVANLAAADGVVYLSPGNYPIGANYTIPAYAHLIFAKGAYCTIANGVVLTINGTIEAGPWQIFAWAGTGAVVFGLGAVEQVYTEWWGAEGDGVTDDYAAVNAAIISDQPVKFLEKTYIIGTALSTTNDFQKISGDGIRSVIKASNDFSLNDNILTYAGAEGDNIYAILLQDIKFDCNSRADGVKLQHSQACTIRNLRVHNNTNWGFETYGHCVMLTVYSIEIQAVTTGNGIQLYGYDAGDYKSYDNAFYGVRCNVKDYGFNIKQQCWRNHMSMVMIDVTSDDAGCYGVQILDDYNYNNAFYDLVVENHPTGAPVGTGILSTGAQRNVWFNVRVTGGQFAVLHDIHHWDFLLEHGKVSTEQTLSMHKSLLVNGRWHGVSPDATLEWKPYDNHSFYVNGDDAWDTWDFPVQQPNGAYINEVFIYIDTDDPNADTKIQIFKAEYNDNFDTQVGGDYDFVGAGTHLAANVNYEIEHNYHVWVRVRIKRSAGINIQMYPLVVGIDYL